MKTAIAYLKGVGPLSQSRFHNEPKQEKESNEDYDLRTWKKKAHVDEKGRLYHPPIAFKRAVDEAVKRSGKRIPGRNRATYTKHFVSGVQVFDVPFLHNGKQLTEDDLVRRAQLVSAQGKKGSAGGTSVVRNFPDIHDWETEVTFHIADDTITKSVFEEALQEAGKFVGIGVFRPENGGFYGRFEVLKIEWDC